MGPSVEMTMATASLSHNSDWWACPPGALLEGSGAALVAKERRQDRGASVPQRQPEGGAGVLTGQDLSSTEEPSLTGLRVTLHNHPPGLSMLASSTPSSNVYITKLASPI